MKKLQEKIRQEGSVIQERILKVDGFLNHQVDPAWMMEIGATFAELYALEGVTKVITIESSGIPPALATAQHLGVPVIYARKTKSLTTQNEVYQSRVYSYTKQQHYEITISKKFLTASDRVLIIDDFLANGEAAFGLIDMVKQAKAEIVGLGIVIEKSFQPGGERLRSAGYRVESLARIASLQGNEVQFVPECHIVNQGE